MTLNYGNIKVLNKIEKYYKIKLNTIRCFKDQITLSTKFKAEWEMFEHMYVYEKEII